MSMNKNCTSAVKSKARTSAGGGASSNTPKTSSISTIITAKTAKEQKQKAPSKQVKAISPPKTAIPKCTVGGSGGFRQSKPSGTKGEKKILFFTEQYQISKKQIADQKFVSKISNTEFILFIGKTDAVQPAQNTAVLMETDCARDDKVNDVIGE